MSEISRPARLENLQEIISFITHCAEAGGFTPKRVNETQLAAEEALVNIFNYAYPESPGGEVLIKCEHRDGDSLFIEFRDHGVPFSFDDLGRPDLSAPIASRKIGGLGVFLIRKMVDDVRFRRENNENILTFLLRPRAHDPEPAEPRQLS